MILLKVVSVLLLTSSWLYLVSTSVAAATLTVNIKLATNLELKPNSQLHIELHKLPEKIPNFTPQWLQAKQFKLHQVRLDAVNSVKFTQLSFGTYALRVFQDLNSDGELNTTARGVPLEPVGFSNSPVLANGEPTIEACQFVVDSANNSIELKMRYKKPSKTHRLSSEN